MRQVPRIAMVAGEASSDQLAAHLITALKQHLPDAEFYGIGGPKMQREGFESLWPAEMLAVRGYAEVLRHYRAITRMRRRLLRRLLQDKPDAFIGVDGSDFNLWLERRLKRHGIPTIHFVSPSIWAWRRKRMAKIVQSVSHILALYPFEPELYRDTPVKCSYVGHPLADVIPLQIDQRAVRERLGIAAGRPVIALLPGSRQSELHYMAETFIETAKLLLERQPQLQFLVPLVSRETRLQFETALWKLKADELPFTLMFGHAADAIAASDAALVASGTATLETALVGRPMVIAYKMSPWSWRLMRGMRYLPWVGLPNILAGRYVVPEFLQDDATPENLSQALGNLLVDRQVGAAIFRVFDGIHRLLRQDTAQKAAAAVLPYLQRA
ncbi:lipid-A-disaccharide synthase [Sulfuritalea sp.]|uniref:lipid-A-disaccharide synthase n=1 Tax=Sulfuritalea sp. TaxID=2480090 RepID=UPI001AD3281A|nr:lipid-A-disaccharide synthase [Sulfuritalea sp.]MBN8474691.1 lipid-A-disaccharide synthase [Sulfuritalea sp.]